MAIRAGGILDLALFVGDYIYESSNPNHQVRTHEGPVPQTLPAYRARHATYKLDADLRAAHAAHPWILTWDDHEVENDYANDRGQSGGGLGFLLQRAAAYQAYWEHLPFPKSMRPQRSDMRIVQRFDWGRLARIHALDDRQYRDPQVCVPPLKACSARRLSRVWKLVICSASARLSTCE